MRGEQAGRRLPSVSAAVVQEGEVIWQDAVGLADVEAGVEATPDTQYQIGSITKTFTAAAIMLLRDAGDLDLDDPLGRHIPDAALGTPTLRGLLAHLSGLQREIPGEVWETLRFPSADELVARLAEAEIVLPPGGAWHYSNLAFALLGEVASRRSGRGYPEFVRERLLDPLGLTRTTWAAEQPAAQGYFVEPYTDLVRREPIVEREPSVAAAGGLWSTTRDLCRWAAFLARPDPRVLAPETVEEMHGFQAMKDEERWTVGWGLGLELYRRGDRIFAGHAGAMPGQSAGLAVSRREKIGAVAFANADAAEMEELALRLAETAIEAAPPDPQPWRPQDAPPAELAGMLGRWWSEGHEFVFSYRHGRLQANRVGAPAHEPPAFFASDGDGRFRTVAGRERGELLRVVRDDAGEVVRLYWATYPFTRQPEVFG